MSILQGEGGRRTGEGVPAARFPGKLDRKHLTPATHVSLTTVSKGSPPSSLPSCPFHKWKIWGSEMSRNSPRVIQHLSDELECESRSS